MSYVSVWVHFVWSTKHREPFFDTPALRKTVFTHIRTHGREQGIHVDFVNGYTDHVHALVSLEPTQCVADVAKTLKGESSAWLQSMAFVSHYFAWQTDYFAVSVSGSLLNKTRRYIQNQENHHQRQSYEAEQETMMKKWGFVLLPDSPDKSPVQTIRCGGTPQTD